MHLCRGLQKLRRRTFFFGLHDIFVFVQFKIAERCLKKTSELLEEIKMMKLDSRKLKDYNILITNFILLMNPVIGKSHKKA